MSLVRNLDAKDSKKDISNRVRKNLIFIISGPSGVGKTTLIKRLLSLPDLKTTLVKSVSFTTRTPRKDERDKKDYYFLTREEFILKKRKGELLEWTKYLGHFYGTDWTFIDNLLEKGKDVLLCLDTKGAFKVRKRYPKNSVLIFILPSSFKVLEERLKERTKEEGFNLTERLRKAKEEISLAKEYDYRILNEKIDVSVKKLKEIILKERRWAINL